MNSKIADNYVGKALRDVNPGYQQASLNQAEQKLDPFPYHASHFGHKLDIGQNEKLIMYGGAHICTIDGFSAKVVWFISAPVKKNAEVYGHVCPSFYYCNSGNFCVH